MAEANISVGQDQFICPVCLDLLKDPVAIPCGHSYCMSCITGCWNQDDQKGVYSCPQCRQTFFPRPVLGKNTILAEMVEKLKKTTLQTDVPAGSGDVECDICTGRKHKAIKSCLVCLESYCQTHFVRHEEFRSGNRHKVIDATGELEQMFCPQHRKQLEIYCRTDKCCICYLCTMDQHKNHDTVTATEERTEKQKQLEGRQSDYQRRIQKTEKDLMDLRENVKTHRRSAQKAVEDCERNFTELIHSIEKSRSKVTQLIRDQEKAAVSQTEKWLKQLEQDIDTLRRRNAELEQLSCTDNDIHFLKNFHGGAIKPFFSFRFKNIDASHLLYDDIGKSVSQLKEKLEDLWTVEIEKLTAREAAAMPNIRTNREVKEMDDPVIDSILQVLRARQKTPRTIRGKYFS